MTMVGRASRWLAVVLVVGFSACGGGGGGGGDPAPAVVGSKIFVGDSGHGLIGSAANSNPSAGTGVVDRTISGGSTFLTTGPLAVKDFAIDAANDRLYVADSTRILAFNNVSTASGNVAPRVVANAGSDTFGGIYLDTVNNRLYAIVRQAVPGNDQVRVYDSASTATNATATRTFSFPTTFMFDIAVDPTLNVAYVYHLTTFAHVEVFTGAATLSGSLTPTQTIDLLSGPPSTAAVGMFLDSAHDRLYVPNISGGTTATVEVYDTAHSASGTGTQSRTITLAGVSNYTNVFVETNANRLYAADPFGVTIAPNASTTTSSVGGVRVLAPAGSTFTAVAVKP
jgi:hypothetical protein